MDWEAIRNVFIQFLQENLEGLENSAKVFAEEFIQKLRGQGYQLTPEEEARVSQWAKEQSAFIRDLIYRTAGMVAVTSTVKMADKFISEIAEEVINRKYPDGLTLSTRLWNWEAELKTGLRNVLMTGVRMGSSVSKITYDMQYTIEALRGEEFAITLKEKLPKWVEELRSSARTVIRNPEMHALWEETLRKVERKIQRLSRTTSRASAKKLIEELSKAIEKGQEELIERGVRWWIYDKQLSRLRTIAQTETANAFHLAQIKATEEDPDIIGYRWKLSRSHPRPDVCDVLATVDYGYGKGVHPKDRVPRQKPHPHCLCYLIPVTRRKGMRRKKEEELDKETLRKIAPQYVRDLEALGVGIEKLWDKELNAFVRKRDLVERVGWEEFKLLQTVGRTARAGKWKEKVKTEYLLNDLLDVFGSEDNFPAEIKGLLRASELDSLTAHYIKRKYVDGWELDSPEALDRMLVEHIKNPKALIYQQGNRYALELGRYVAIIHPPDTKISIFRLRDRYRDYEDYAKQTGRPIIKLWQLGHILRRL